MARNRGTRGAHPAPAGVRAVPVAVAIGLAGAFAVLSVLVVRRWSPLMSLDRSAVVELNGFDRHAGPYLDVMRAVSKVAIGASWFVVLGATATWLALRRQWRLSAFVAVAAIGSSLLNTTLKDLVHRPRPVLAHPVDAAHGWSFPSGHAQWATVGCAVLLIVLLPQLSRWASSAAVSAAVVVVAVVGLSRMSLGVHYPSDVLGAVLCGAAWTLGLAGIMLTIGRPAPVPVRPAVAGPGNTTADR